MNIVSSTGLQANRWWFLWFRFCHVCRVS